MTSHKKHSRRQPNYGVDVKPLLDTTVTVVGIGAVATVGVAALSALKK